MTEHRAPVLVFGNGGHALAVLDALSLNPEFQVWATVVSSPGSIGRINGNVRAVRLEDIKDMDAGYCRHAVIAVGDNSARQSLEADIRALFPNLKFVTVIHPSATVAKSAVVSEGAMIMAGAVIGPDTIVGKHTIVNTNASLDHHSSIGDFSSLGPNSAVGGGTEIGSLVAVGLGASVLHNLKIESECVIAAGAVVTKSLETGWVYVGVPAKGLRPWKPHDPYL